VGVFVGVLPFLEGDRAFVVVYDGRTDFDGVLEGETVIDLEGGSSVGEAVIVLEGGSSVGEAETEGETAERGH
jgi:hypothetical protein